MELDTIYNMDCMDGMKQIPDGSVDMVLCDLPYGTTCNKWDSVLHLQELWGVYRRVTKKNRRMFRYEWIWEKNIATGFLNAKKMPLKCHENVLVFYDALPTYHPQYFYASPYHNKRQGRKFSKNYGKQMQNCSTECCDGKRYPRDVLMMGVERGCGLTHPTQKPVELCEYLIRTYTNAGETVLDNCMGSGTTAVAAINTGRHFIGFEKEKEYFDIAMKRIEDARMQTRLAL